MTDYRQKEIIAKIQKGEKLDKSMIYDLFGGDDEDVFLFWNGRKEEVTNVTIPKKNYGKIIDEMNCY